MVCFVFFQACIAKALPVKSKLTKENVVNPLDHLNVIKLNAKGTNRDYNRELFFGHKHDAIVPKSATEAKFILSKLLNR